MIPTWAYVLAAIAFGYCLREVIMLIIQIGGKE